MAKVAHFNVGGKQYKVSHSLLEMHPNSLLAQSASKQMQVNPGEEIYLDRDGNIFKYVLNYLRNDGRVYLPMTYISKAAFLTDLVYYGINVNESKIVCNYGCAARVLVEMNDEIKSWDAHSDIVTLAKKCVLLYSKFGCKLQIEIHDPRISLPIPNDDDDDTIPMCSLDTWMAVLSLFCTDGNEIFPHAQVECKAYQIGRAHV